MCDLVLALGFEKHSITGVSLSSSSLKAHVQVITGLKAFDATRAQDISIKLLSRLQFERHFSDNMFAFLLIDGLSMAEEGVTAELYNALPIL